MSLAEETLAIKMTRYYAACKSFCGHSVAILQVACQIKDERYSLFGVERISTYSSSKVNKRAPTLKASFTYIDLNRWHPSPSLNSSFSHLATSDQAYFTSLLYNLHFFIINASFGARGNNNNKDPSTIMTPFQLH